MSKMDNLRAMREARYEAARAGAATTRTTAKTPRQAPPATGKPAKAEVAPEPEQEGMCGHRNISGRTCTRDKGHSAKTHRYS